MGQRHKFESPTGIPQWNLTHDLCTTFQQTFCIWQPVDKILPNLPPVPLTFPGSQNLSSLKMPVKSYCNPPPLDHFLNSPTPQNIPRPESYKKPSLLRNWASATCCCCPHFGCWSPLWIYLSDIKYKLAVNSFPISLLCSMTLSQQSAPQSLCLLSSLCWNYLPQTFLSLADFLLLLQAQHKGSHFGEFLDNHTGPYLALSHLLCCFPLSSLTVHSTLQDADPRASCMYPMPA